MFLAYNSNISFVGVEPSESAYTPPAKLNFTDFSTPVKSINGYRSGPTMVASFLESIHFRKDTALKMKQATIDSLIASAWKKDKDIKSDDFVYSDDQYVTLKSYLEAVKEEKIIKGNVEWSNSITKMKQYIHKYGFCIVETYLANSFLTQNAKGKFDIKDAGSGEIHVGDYTKAFVAFGYDSTGVIVLNSLGAAWGCLGFARISWGVFSSMVLLPNGDNRQCFIKTAAFKGGYN